MLCEPAYVSRTQRAQAAWEKTGHVLGLSAAIAREAYLERYCTYMQAGDFHRLVARKDLTREKVLERTSTEQLAAQIEQRAAKRTSEWEDSDPDDLDRINYRCKGVLQIGDEWQCEETATYTFSKGEYLTKGKRYKILDFKDEGFGEFTIVVATNFPGADGKHWTSSHAIKRLYRDGKLVWDWRAAYIQDWNEHHPDNLFPLEPGDTEVFVELGWPVPTSG